MIGLVDTGADVSILDSDMLQLGRRKTTSKIFNKKFISTQVKTFTGGEVKIKQLITLPVQVGQAQFEFQFYITYPTNSAVKLILGRNFIQLLEASVIFRNDTNLISNQCAGHQYTFQMLKPMKQNIQLLHIAIPGSYEVISVTNYNLEPQQQKYVKFQLSYNPFITRKDQVMVTNCPGDRGDALLIIPTTCRPDFLDNGKLEVYGLVINKSHRLMSTKALRAVMEPLPVGQFDHLTFNAKNRSKILSILTSQGLARYNLSTSPKSIKSRKGKRKKHYKPPGRVMCNS